MRHLFGILTFLGLLLGLSRAAVAAQGFHIVPATNNIGTSFSTSAPLVQTLVNPTTKHMYVSNTCSGALAFTFSNSSANVAPSSSISANPLQVFIGASSSSQFNFLGAGKYVWIRSDAGVCVAGDVTVSLW
jgi:hypothetical protein